MKSINWSHNKRSEIKKWSVILFVMLFTLYKITLMMIIPVYLLLTLKYLKPLRVWIYLAIYMLYSTLYTHGHLLSMAYIGMYIISYWLLLFLKTQTYACILWLIYAASYFLDSKVKAEYSIGIVVGFLWVATNMVSRASPQVLHASSLSFWSL